MTRPGRADVRTGLAWDRTALSAAGLGALLVRTGLVHQVTVEVLAGVTALLLALTLSRLVRLRQVERSRVDVGRSRRVLVLVAGLAVLTAVLTAAAVITG